MVHPVGVRLRDDKPIAVHLVSFDAAFWPKLAAKRVAAGGAVVAVQDFEIAEKFNAGIIDLDEVEVLVAGDWNNAVLLVRPDNEQGQLGSKSAETAEIPDQEFLNCVKRTAPDIYRLAEDTVRALRDRGILGQLREEGGRWVNRPLNTFTLKIQPRAGNLQFTLYGDAERFGAGDLLRSDQNGYSRGWIRASSDVEKFAEFVTIADQRKRR